MIERVKCGLHDLYNKGSEFKVALLCLIKNCITIKQQTSLGAINSVGLEKSMGDWFQKE